MTKLTLYGKELPILSGPTDIGDGYKVSTQVTMEQYHQASNALDLQVDDESRVLELHHKGAYSVDEARMGGLLDIEFTFSARELGHDDVKSFEGSEI